MAVTLKDIAKQVGLSVTTVSRALAGYDDVAEETRQRIVDAARDMGYVPNVVARQLQKQRTDTIGFVVPTFGPRFSDPFFAEFLAGIGNEAARNGFDLLVSTQAPGPDELAAYERITRSHRVDGLILARTRRRDQRIAYCVKNGFPFVAFGRTELSLDFPYIDVDGRLGLYLATRHLIDLGHQRIAHLAAPLELMFTHYRLLGYRQALEEAGLPWDEDLVMHVPRLTEEEGHRAAQTLLGLDSPPTAIAACSDLMALTAMTAAGERGLVVGQDVAITGYDDIPLAQYCHPTLTTVHQPVYRIATTLCRMLIQITRGEEPKECEILEKPTLITRESSGARKFAKGGDSSHQFTVAQV